MNAVKLARSIGLARAAFGVALLARPQRLSEPWIGSDALGAGTQVAVRGLGGRDLVLGLGTLASSGRDQQRWLAAGIAGDLADLTATLAAGRRVPLRGQVLVGAVASAGIALGARALSGLRD